MSNLTGRVAIVTGSGSGIGQATAELLAERGAAVVVADINAAAAETVAAGIRARGLQSVAVATDVADETQIQRMTDAAVTQFGGLDIVHNNAALLAPDVIARDLKVTDLDAELFARVLQVNVIGYALGAKHAIPHMLVRGGGVLINTSSAAGIQGELIRPMYGRSKAAIIGLTRNIATEYGKQGIRSARSRSPRASSSPPPSWPPLRPKHRPRSLGTPSPRVPAHSPISPTPAPPPPTRTQRRHRPWCTEAV
jgi:NAD(P)-dependent dehydrogenase (short-subunit alcohol dehydrogenase family)